MSDNHNQYQYNDIPEFPQPQPQPPLPPRPSYTNSTFTQKEHDPSPLLSAEERASRRSVALKTFLITAGIVISIAGLIFAFLSYLCVFHQCHVSGHSIISTAPLGRVLTISQVTSHVAPISVPIVMGLFSYFISARWLRSSNNRGPDRPSPMQLGLLISMCDGAGLNSLLYSIRYYSKPPRAGQRRIGAPPILRQSMYFLGSILAVTYLAVASDAWLHASSTSVFLSSNKPYTASIPNFGRGINATTCEIASQLVGGTTPDPTSTKTCGLLNGGALGLTAELGEGIRVADNSSRVHQMVLTDDQTVIMIPLSIPSNITYTAQTLGVKSKCETITKRCLDPQPLSGGTLNYGPDVVLYLNCTKAGINYVNSSSTATHLCALDSQGLCTGWNTITTNPYSVGEVTTSRAYIDPDTVYSEFLNGTGWFFHGESGAWNVVLCNVSVLDVTYTYESSRYITKSSSLAPLNTTQAISSPMFVTNGGTAKVSTAVDGAGINNDPPYELVYSYELSRQILGRAGYIYSQIAVLDIQSEVDVDGSRLQLAPMVIFFVALGIFACQVMYLFLLIIIGTWSTRYVELAALYLRDPLTTVQRLYGHPNPPSTWEVNGDEKMGEYETEEDRLRVGPVPVSNNPAHGSIFLVTKG